MAAFGPRSLALAASALLALAGPLPAQDRSGRNLDPDGAGAPGAVAQLALAQQLYAIGLANKDALTVLAAARLAGSIDARDVEQKKETRPSDRAAGPEGVDAPADAVAMLTAARDLAGSDDTLLGLIEDAEAEGARGAIGGAAKSLSRLDGGAVDVWDIAFYGNSLAELAVLGDGDSDLDLQVTDENGNEVCRDDSPTDKIYCDWVPAWNGQFKITVENTGTERNSYYLMTN